MNQWAGDLWDYNKHTNYLHYRGPRMRRGGKGAENILEDTLIENFPNLGMEIVMEAESQRGLTPRGKYQDIII